MRLKVQLICLLHFTYCSLVSTFDTDTVLRYFDPINAGSIVLCLCSEQENRILHKEFIKRNKTVVSIDLDNVYPSHVDYVLNTPDRLGIVVNAECSKNIEMLHIASLSKNFHYRRVWLVFWKEALNLEIIRKAAVQATPPLFDIGQYFLDEYEGMRERARLEQINSEVNAKLIAELDEEQKLASSSNASKIQVTKDVHALLQVEAMVDSELTVAVPTNDSKTAWSFWSIHKKTNYSSMEIDILGTAEIGRKFSIPAFEVPTSLRRNDFHRTVMRAACSLFFYDYFNRSDELTSTKIVDVWSQMTFTHTKLIEEMLNLRMLVKCFADYGWPVNGSFTGLVGFLQRHKADMTATGFVLHVERLNVADYVDGTFQFKLGILFRQPPLAQVTNIFVLPFSREVWLCLMVLLAVAGTVFYTQLRIRLGERHSIHEHLGEVVSFLSGAMCQQGCHLVDKTLTVRVSMVVVLISTIFFFTSYTATIVALLQSPSHLINSLETFVDSPLAFAIEDLPYEKKFFAEDSHEVVTKIFEEKVVPQGEKAYLEISDGIERVRQGLFAFQCELANAYKRIEETYTEGEKCGLEKLDLFPDRMLGPGVPKRSPFREILTGRMRWLREIGITSRALNRWFHEKPKCESKSTGFSSIGIVDITPLIQIWLYGIAAAFGVLLLEILIHPKGILRKHVMKEKPVGNLRHIKIVNQWKPPVLDFRH